MAIPHRDAHRGGHHHRPIDHASDPAGLAATHVDRHAADGGHVHAEPRGRASDERELGGQRHQGQGRRPEGARDQDVGGVRGHHEHDEADQVDAGSGQDLDLVGPVLGGGATSGRRGPSDPATAAFRREASPSPPDRAGPGSLEVAKAAQVLLDLLGLDVRRGLPPGSERPPRARPSSTRAAVERPTSARRAPTRRETRRPAPPTAARMVGARSRGGRPPGTPGRVDIRSRGGEDALHPVVARHPVGGLDHGSWRGSGCTGGAGSSRRSGASSSEPALEDLLRRHDPGHRVAAGSGVHEGGQALGELLA